jgi:hypothetical protein
VLKKFIIIIPDCLWQIIASVLAVWVVFIPTSNAACIDVLLPDELPAQVVTRNDTVLNYTYRLETEEYFISWLKDSSIGGPLGPFHLERNCLPAAVAVENDNFIVFERNCGTFCWSYSILSLTAVAGSTDDQFRNIMRPLAFDSARSLVAYYASQDLIVIRNLVSGYEQQVPTQYECYTASGLCFDDVELTDSNLMYTWESTTQSDDEVISHVLSEALIAP